MLTLFKNIKFSLKINLSNFGNDRHMRHNKPQIDHVNVNFCWCYWGSSDVGTIKSWNSEVG